MMSSESGKYWDRRSKHFDAIYSQQRSWIGRCVDSMLRQNLLIRFHFTMEQLEPMMYQQLLDVGCGPGRYCVELASRGAKQVTGIDLSSDMLSIAEQSARELGLADRCTFIHADILAYQTTEPFDGVWAMGVFDYVRNALEMLKHLRSLTREKLIVSFPWKYALRVPFRKIWLATHRCPVYFYTQRQVRRLCVCAGFEPQQLFRSGPILLLVAKPIQTTSPSGLSIP